MKWGKKMDVGFKDFTRIPLLNKIDNIIDNLWEKCNFSDSFSIKEFIKKTGGKITSRHPLKDNNYSMIKEILGKHYSEETRCELLFSSRNNSDGQYTIFIRKDTAPNEYAFEILRELALEFISDDGISVLGDILNKDFYKSYFSLGMQYPRKKFLEAIEEFCKEWFKTDYSFTFFTKFEQVEPFIRTILDKKNINMSEADARKWLEIVYENENFKNWKNQKVQEDFYTIEDIVVAIKSQKSYRSIKDIVHDFGGHFSYETYSNNKVTLEIEESGKFRIGIPSEKNLNFSLDEPQNYIILGLLLNIFYNGDVTEKEKEVFGKKLMNCSFDEK